SGALRSCGGRVRADRPPEPYVSTLAAILLPGSPPSDSIAAPERLILPARMNQKRQAIADHAGDQQRGQRVFIDVLRQIFAGALALPIKRIAGHASLLPRPPRQILRAGGRIGGDVARLLAEVAGHRLGLFDRLIGCRLRLLHRLVGGAALLLSARLIVRCRASTGVLSSRVMPRRVLVHLLCSCSRNPSTKNIRCKESL